MSRVMRSPIFEDSQAHMSEKIIHKLVMETTAMGNKHWSQIPEGHVAVAPWRTFASQDVGFNLRKSAQVVDGFSHMFHFPIYV